MAGETETWQCREFHPQGDPRVGMAIIELPECRKKAV